MNTPVQSAARRRVGVDARRVVSRCVGGVFVAAAIVKVVSPKPAMVSIAHTLGGVSSGPNAPRIALDVMTGVVMVEIALGAVLLLGWRRRLCLNTAVVMLSAFSAFLIFLLADPSAPGCGCAGAVRLAESARAENLLGLGRNALLIAACVWATPARPGLSLVGASQQPSPPGYV